MSELSNCRPIDEWANTVGCGPERETLVQLSMKMGKQVSDCLTIAENILAAACGLERPERGDSPEILSMRDELAIACYRLGRLQSVLDELWNEVHV